MRRVAGIPSLLQYFEMTDRLLIARFVQVAFFVTDVSLLFTIYLGLRGVGGMLIALAATLPFSALILFGMRCGGCGVSYYFDPKGEKNLTGMNLLKPVQARRPKRQAGR